jgi:hypothetical protein
MTEAHTHLWASLKQFCEQRETQSAEISAHVTMLSERQALLEGQVSILCKHLIELSELAQRLSERIEFLLRSQDVWDPSLAEQPAPEEGEIRPPVEPC